VKLTLAEIAEAVGSTVSLGKVRVTGVSTDTRTIEDGDLFIALRGERFDGHDHIAEAFARGAAAVVVEKPVEPEAGLHIVVADTLKAYGAIARCWRRRFDIPVIAITGSVGKTTTKEMTALALSPLGPVLKTEHNENNEIGLPKTLLRLSSKHKAVVLEMGMRGAGQIDYLARIAEPTVAIVTIIGESHIEILGSRDAIADAKGELLAALPPGGIALINHNDEFSSRLRRRTPSKVLTFGDSKAADIAMINPQRSESGWSTEIRFPDGSMQTLHLATSARHDLINASAAAGAAMVAEVEPLAALRALQSYTPGAMRMEQIKLPGGAMVLSDCYNAAPTSIRSALETLAGTHGGGRRVAFLGDMKELGTHAAEMHAQVGAYASALGIEEVYTVGPEFGKLPSAVRRFDSSTEAADFARTGLLLHGGDTVLVKGSRAMAMEAIVEALVNG